MPHHSVQWSLSFGSQSKGKGSLRRTPKSSLREKWSHDMCRPTFLPALLHIFTDTLFALRLLAFLYVVISQWCVHLDDSVWTEYAIEVVIVEHTSSTTTSFHLQRDIVSYKYKHTHVPLRYYIEYRGHQSEATHNQIKESSNSLNHVQIFAAGQFIGDFLFTCYIVVGQMIRRWECIIYRRRMNYY